MYVCSYVRKYESTKVLCSTKVLSYVRRYLRSYVRKYESTFESTKVLSKVHVLYVLSKYESKLLLSYESTKVLSKVLSRVLSYEGRTHVGLRVCYVYTCTCTVGFKLRQFTLIQAYSRPVYVYYTYCTRTRSRNKQVVHVRTFMLKFNLKFESSHCSRRLLLGRRTGTNACGSDY